MPRHGRALASVGVAALLSGCVGIVEQQFTYYVQNDLDDPVIVRFAHFGDLLVESGVNGRTPSTFGTFDGPIVVMDASCRVLQTIEVTTQVGSLWLRSDGTARFVETEYDSAMAQLPHTDRCAASG